MELPSFWRMGRYDFFVWIVTWSATTFLSVTMGLVIGMAASCLTVIAQTRAVRGYLLRRSENGVLVRADRYKVTPTADDPSTNVYIFRYPSMVYFANIDNFVQQLYAATINPASRAATVNPGNRDDITALPEMKCGPDYERPWRPTALVVVDCCEVSYVDTMFLTRIFSVRSAYEGAGVTFTLAGVNRTVVSRLNKVADELNVPRMRCYLHVDDALVIHEAELDEATPPSHKHTGFTTRL